MDMRKLFTAAAFASAALGCCAAANAALVEGTGVVTDTNTGLEWLSLNATQGINYNSILNGYGGYIANGWTVATAQQISQLALSYIGTPDCAAAACGTLNEYHDPTKILDGYAVMASLGFTSAGYNNGTLSLASRGYFNDLDPTNGLAGSGQFNLSLSFNPSLDKASWQTVPNAVKVDPNPADTVGLPDYGTFLVKDAPPPPGVPAPQTWALFGVGLAGIAFTRRRQLRTAHGK
jgi:hypothetical protein